MSCSLAHGEPNVRRGRWSVIWRANFSQNSHKNDPIGRGDKTTDRPIGELLNLHTIDISVEVEKPAKSVKSPSSWDSGRLVSSIEQDEKYWSSICEIRAFSCDVVVVIMGCCELVCETWISV